MHRGAKDMIECIVAYFAPAHMWFQVPPRTLTYGAED